MKNNTRSPKEIRLATYLVGVSIAIKGLINKLINRDHQNHKIKLKNRDCQNPLNEKKNYNLPAPRTYDQQHSHTHTWLFFTLTEEKWKNPTGPWRWLLTPLDRAATSLQNGVSVWREPKPMNRNTLEKQKAKQKPV